MHEPGVMLVDLSIEQWVAFIGFVIATIGFFIWVADLVRKKK
jgi:hypothetical protein